MAELIRLSQSEAEASKKNMASKGEAFLQNLRTLDAEVTKISGWYKGEAAVRFVDKYFNTVKPGIVKMVNECVAEYGELLTSIVRTQQEADAQIAAKI